MRPTALILAASIGLSACAGTPSGGESAVPTGSGGSTAIAQVGTTWERLADGSIRLFDGRLIPPLPELLGVRAQYDLRLQWLDKKHGHLLEMMRQHGVGAWIIVNHEFNDDPATPYVAPDLVYVSRRDLHVFVDAGDAGLERFSSYGRPNADHARLFESLPTVESEAGGGDVGARLEAIIDRYRPATIALNMGGNRGHNSALTHDAYQFIVEALGPEMEQRLISSRELIEQYFDTRLPEELEPYRRLVLATDVLTQQALSNVVITPGVTTAGDLKWWFNQQIADLGAGAEPWFEIHTAVQRFESATGTMIPYVHPAPDDLVYQQGDIIHLDTGFNYLGFASDWQKVAYVLRDGEDDVPEGLKVAPAQCQGRPAGHAGGSAAGHDRPRGHDRDHGVARGGRLPAQPLFPRHRLPGPRAGAQHQRSQHGSGTRAGARLGAAAGFLSIDRVERYDGDPGVERRDADDPLRGRRPPHRRGLHAVPAAADELVLDSLARISQRLPERAGPRRHDPLRYSGQETSTATPTYRYPAARFR